MNGRILIVDDELDVLHLMGRALARDHDVVLRSTMEQALEDIAEGEIDLLLTDLRLTSGSGFELIERAREIDPELFVIVMSAHIDFEDPQDRMILRRCCDDVLLKPFDHTRLLKCVSSWMRSNRAESPPLFETSQRPALRH